VRRAHRVDGPHRAIRQALEAVGCHVLDVSGSAGLGCDLVVWTPAGTAYACEVKSGHLAPSKRKLTDSEIKLALRMPKHFRVVGSVDEALRLAGVKA
jgi:hypothetical protein